MDKVGTARNHIINLLESGQFKDGEKLPGARELCTSIDASFVMVQTALASLVREGVIESVPRRGTFVCPGWRDRILRDSMVVYKTTWSWLGGLKEILSRKMPELHIREQFKSGTFELRTTIAMQRDRNEYMDLSGLLKDVYADCDEFFAKPFAPFHDRDGRLYGIPFIFSPRVMFYNPRLLESAGCSVPSPDWTWDEFIGSVRKIRKVMPDSHIFDWGMETYRWMNIVFRAGGRLIDPAAADPVKIDDERTKLGLRLYTELKKELGDKHSHCDEFAQGNMAFMLAPREELNKFKALNFNDWQTVKLPSIPGGAELTTQATDLLCIRKSCGDMDAAREFIRVMLSEEVQDFIAAERYGIPIRKSSAMKSINPEEERDTLFMIEMAKMSAEYNIDSPDLTSMVENGITGIWKNHADIDQTCSKLAEALRTFIFFSNSSTANGNGRRLVNF
jgi:hypothetical protein